MFYEYGPSCFFDTKFKVTVHYIMLIIGLEHDLLLHVYWHFMLSYITCTKIRCCILCGYHSLIGFFTGNFVMVPLNLTYLHCLQHSFFEHLFNLYYICVKFLSYHIRIVKVVHSTNFQHYMQKQPEPTTE